MKFTKYLITFISLFFVTGCVSIGPYTVDLAEPPEYYVQNQINPLENAELFEENIVPIFYATNREPWESEGKHFSFYKNKRSRDLTVGKAMVQIGKKGTDWEELKEFITTKGRRPRHPMKVLDVEEYGTLDFARQRYDTRREIYKLTESDRRLIEEINDKLAKSKKKNITIFVHGVRVPFEDPVLVAAQLAFYGGFDGVVMGFSWPSQQKTFRYFADVEQTQYAARFLSFLLAFLSRFTDVDQINIIAHSAGTRILSRSLTDISLLGGLGTDRDEEAYKKFKIGNVVFAGGDLSRDVMGVYMEYGIMEVPEKVLIYFSETDKALGLSNWLWQVGRIGNLDFSKLKLPKEAVDYLKSFKQLELVDATGTPGSNKSHGHVYF